MKTLFNRLTVVITAIILISGLLFYNSCTKDSGPFIVPPKNAPVISFKDTIQPILTTYCAKSGCHVTGGQAPDLSSGNAYNSLISGGFINTSTPTSSIVYQYLTGAKSPAMPLGGSSNPSNINILVLTWIEQGALNN